MAEEPDRRALRTEPVVLLLIAAFVLFQLWMYFGSHAVRVETIVALGLFPARFFEAGLEGLPGGGLHGAVSLITYSLLHGGWAHCLINAVWMLAFGTPVAQRLGWKRFVFFYALCVVLAGLVQVAATSRAGWLIPIIGASGGVSAMMGAAIRFAFSPAPEAPPQPLAFPAPAEYMRRRRLLPIREALTHRPVVIFIIVWVGINLIFGLLAPAGMATPDGRPIGIAWQAHLGGFLAGLLLIGLIDRMPLSPSGGPGNVDYGRWQN